MLQVLAKLACGLNDKGKPLLDGIPSRIPKLTSEIFLMIEIAVPVLLVIMGTIDLFKGVTADKEDEMVKGRKLFIKRLITGALVFFVIAITKFALSIFDEKNSARIMNCVNCFINNECVIDKNAEKREQEKTTKEQTKTEEQQVRNNANPTETEKQQQVKNDADQQKNEINNDSDTKNTNIKVVDSSEVINVGDSGVASSSSNGEPLGKKTGALTETYSTVNYYLYVPSNATKGMPLVIFLHGIGEKGDISAVKRLKPVTIVTDGTLSGLEQFIFLAPTSPRSTHWGDSTTWGNLIKLVDHIVTEYSIDTSRIYLTGFSAGGCGVWGLVNKYPNKFGAAVAVSCTPGSINPANFKNTPLYAISGGSESYVSGMQNTVNSINSKGGKAQFKTIPNAGHIATQNSYSTKELYSWLLSQ